MQEAPAGRALTWLKEQGTVGDDAAVELLTGGFSNITCRVVDPTRRDLVLRRPPLGELPAGAHDVAREAAIIAALAGTDVPVPEIVMVEESGSVEGVPFYLAELVPGAVLRDATDGAALDAGARRRVTEHFVRTLAAIHRLGADDVPLRRSRTPYVRRQLDRWYAQLTASRSLDLPHVDEVHAALDRWAPTADPAALVHGDYHLDNVIFGVDGVAAVLDWELAALGDPLADVALAAAYWTEPGDVGRFPPAATDAPGFGSRADLLALYAEEAGLDLPPMGPYVAFAHWKVACIAEGIHARVVAGAMGDREDDMELIRRHPIARAEAAAAALDGAW